MHDPISGYESHVVGYLYKTFTRTTSSDASSSLQNNWTHYTGDFDYDTYNQYNKTPSYILLTFTTNKTPGAGSTSDILFMDDIEMIYIGKMNDIKVGGVTIPGFNPNTLEYTVCYSGSIPTITATAASKVTRDRNLLNITTPNASNNYTATINRPGSDTTYTIHFVQAPTVNVSPSSVSVCPNETVTLTASGANTYSWSDGLGNNETANAPTSTVGTTQYTVTGTATNGCTATGTATVTVKQTPTITVNGSTSATASICSGATTTLNAVSNPANATLTWAGGSTTTNPLTVNSAGTYTVTANLEGCTSTATVTVTAHENPTVSISGPTSLCTGTTATLTATSGLASYSWSGSVTGTDASLPINSGGNYTVIATDANGCSGTASTTVTSKTTPTITINGTTALCEGTSGTLTATVTPSNATVTWTGGSTGNTLSINNDGTYSATASLDGCESSASATVTAAAAPTAPTANNGSRCGTGTVNLSVNSVDGCTYHWYTSAGTQTEAGSGSTFTTPSISNTTNYWVSAQNANGCNSERVQVTATVHELPSSPSVSNMSVCGTSDITLTATSTNTVQWYTDAEGENQTTTNQIVTNNTTFYAAAIDGNNCRSLLAPLVVTVNPIPAAPEVTQPNAFCSNSSVSVQLTATPASGCIVKWYNSDMSSAGQGSQTKTVDASTTFYATSFNNNTQCESDVTDFNVVINGIPSAPVLTCDPICGAGSDTMTATAGDGLTVKWYTDDETYLADGATYITNLSTTTHFKAKAVNSATGCESPMANVTAVVNEVYHVNDSKTACGSYTWEGTTYDQSGSYTKTLTSKNNCDSIVTLQLTINQGYNHSFDTTVCDQFVWQGSTYSTSQDITKTLKSVDQCDSTVTYHLTVKKSTQSAQSLTLCENQLPYDFHGTSITSEGVKTIKMTNAAGCDSTITLTVTVNPQPGLPTVANVSLCGAGNKTLTASAGTNGTVCQWYATENGDTPFQTGNTYSNTFFENTTYYVSSYNSNSGCESGRIPVNVMVNAVPAVPTVSKVSRCGAGEVTLTATADNIATTCRWFANNTTNTPLFTGYEYTRNVTSALNIYFVESYNENTGCSSPRVRDTAVVNPVLVAPTVTSPSHCGPLTADLADYVTTSADLFRWYDANESLLAENAHYNTTVSEPTTYLVSVYNSTTTCESNKTTLNVTINPTYTPQSIYDTVCQYADYNNHGIQQTFNTTGEKSFVINTKSSTGCDSVVTLYVYVKPQVTYSFSDENCETYSWNNQTYNESGVYTQTFTAANGCDSVVTLQLTIHPAVTSEFSAQECESYTWNNETYSASGDYVQHFQTSHGCDSAVTLHLTILPSYELGYDTTACVQFVWNGQTYDQSGDHTQTFKTVDNCDSIVTMHLTLYEPVSVVFHEEVCAGTTYTGHGFTETFDQPDTYMLIHNGKSVHGCDSTTTLYLTVKPVFAEELYETICAGSSFFFNGEEINEEGDYTAHLTASNGCDSMVVLHLSFYPERHQEYYAEICSGETYNGYGFTIEEPTETLDHLHMDTDINGCDSITTLHLTVHQPVVTDIPVTLCLGDTYLDNNFEVNAMEVGTFTYTQNLQTSHNCDSIVNLIVTVNPISTRELTDETCQFANYTEYGFNTTFTEAGQYTLSNISQNVYGCDSVTTLTLTVHPVFETEVYDTICFNKSYNFHGTILSTTGDYTTTLSSVHGCDSVIYLHLYVRPEKRREISADICYGEAYNEYNFSIAQALETQDYSHVNDDINGCDSTTVLHLTVHQPQTTNIPVTLCNGDEYNNYGFHFTASESTTYTQNLQTTYGCDSTVNLVVTVNPTHHVVLNGEVCVNDTYSENGFDTLFAQAGTYTLFHYGENVFGCDSVTELRLTVRPDYHQNISKMICESGSYVFNGQTLTEAGVYTAELQSQYGCDSIVTLTLTVGAEFRDTIDAHVCYGDSYTQNEFNIQNATETQYHERQYTDVYGCPATTVLHLFVHELNTTDLYSTLCLGETYRLNGFNVTATKVGDTTYTRVIPTVYGCDSTIVLHVTVNPKSIVALTDEICAGNRYQANGFDTLFTEAGVFTLTNLDQNVYNCDSTTTMTLTVWPNLASSIDTTLCFGSSFDFNGKVLDIAGIYVDTLQTIHGCDSVVTLTLDFYPENVKEFADTACVSYTWNETTYTESGDHIQHFTDIHGCDSTVTLHLTIYPASIGDTTAFACNTFDWYEHTGITASCDNLTHTFSNVFGCDSVVTLHLTVGHSNTGDTTAFACNTFDWYEHTGITASCDNLTHTFTNASGCDSVVTLHLTVGHSNTGDTTAFACDTFDWYEHTGITASCDNLTHTFTNASGCDSVVTLHLTVGHSNTGDTTAFACNTFDWYEHTGITASCDNLTHTFTNASGCDSVVTLHLTVGHSNTGDTTAFVCNTFDWYEHTGITASCDNLTHTFTNASGCDSVVTLHLTVGHSNTGDTTAVVCNTFDWYEHTGITASCDNLTHTFINASGCDSVVTLHLTVNYSNAGDTSAVVCESFDWYEHTGITASCSNLTHTFTNASGCDSVVTLNLTVNYGTHNVTETAYCDQFSWNGEIYDSTGIYTYEYVNTVNCPSTDTLKLTIHNSASTTENIVICDSELPYTYGDTVFAVGTPAQSTLITHHTTINGCDSVVTLNLTVNPTYSTDTTVNICDVDLPYMWGDEQYWESDVYTIPYTTVNNCDSIINLHLNVHPTYSQDTTVTVCNGALPYQFDANHSFTATGDYTINLLTANGCDSTWTLHLTVTPNTEHTVTHTICASELPHSFMDTVFTEAGQYDIVEADADNCLTITHFTLIVNPIYHHYDTVTVCEETLPYLYGTTPLTETSDYDIHYSTVNTCDSLITVHFTVIPTAMSADELYVCASDFPVVYGDSTFNEAGVHYVTFQRDGLCDSIVTLTLLQAQEYLFTETDSVCDHALPYLWRGRELTQSGIYFDTLTSIHQCDSVYRLSLTVNETQLIESNPIVLCNGSSEIWRGMTLTQAGVYRDTVNSATTGCYEIHQVSVTVNPSYLFHDTVTICSDELPYHWHGMTLNEAGTREDYNQTVNLCDSIYRLTLIVNPSYHTTETASACDYDLPYIWHQQTISESGTYYDTLYTGAGCDSTFTLTFTVNPSIHEVAQDTICDTELPYPWRGHNLTAAGTYYDTIPNNYGCNDVYEMQLTVNMSNITTIHDTICQGGWYIANGFDTLVTQAGTFYDQLTFTNATGCDSTVNLILQVMPTYLTETDASTCENVPYLWRGGEYSVPGDYYDSLTTVYGCDSVFVLHLSLNPTYDIYLSDSAVTFHEYSYEDFVITPTDSGTYNYDIQYYTIAGCDSIVHLTIYVAFNDGVEEFTMTPEFTFYPNPASVTVNIRGERMRSVEVFNMNGKLLYRSEAETPEFTRIDVTSYPTGNYFVRVLLNNGQAVTGKVVVSRR